MQFLALIYSEEKDFDVDFDTLVSQYEALERELEEAGIDFAGNALQPVSTATTVSVRQDKTVVIDGPFAETKEQLGGYYLFKGIGLEEALKWAAKIPSARHGRIEVRPVMEFED